MWASLGRLRSGKDATPKAITGLHPRQSPGDHLSRSRLPERQRFGYRRTIINRARSRFFLATVLEELAARAKA